MDDKILSPHSNKYIKIGSPSYKKLIKEGYRRKDLIDYTYEPKPIFIHSSSSSEEDEFESLRKKFYNNPGVDPRNPNKRVYKNKKPFLELVKEFGDPYKVEKIKSDFYTVEKIIKSDNLISAMIMTLPFLSYEDVFSLYVSNKDFQEEINLYYLKTKNKKFIDEVRDFLNERHEYLKKLEIERLEHNEKIKQEKILLINRRKEEREREIQEQLEQEREREAIRHDEELLQKRYQAEEEMRKLYAQFNNISILKQLNINNKPEWRKWIIMNHPDKGVTNQYYGLVMEEGRRLGY